MHRTLLDALKAVSGSLTVEYSKVIESLLSPVIEQRADGFESIELKTIVPGLSGAGVLLVEIRSYGTDDIPLVVKYGPAELIAIEASRYRRYVAPKLRTAARLIDSRVEGPVGAVVYELAGSVKEHVDIMTLESYFRACKDGDVHVALLLNILDDMESWTDGVRYSSDSVFSVFKLDKKVPPGTMPSHVSQLLPYAQHDLQTVWNRLSKRWPYRGYYAAIQHGDLNVGNVIIDKKNSGSYLIDFVSVTPQASVFRDLAKLVREALLRLYRLDTAATEQEYIDRLEWLLSPICIFMEQESRPLLSHPSQFNDVESAWALIPNLAVSMRKIIEKIEQQFGESAAHQAKAEALLAMFFQCLLLLLPAPNKPAGQELGAFYLCHRFYDMIRAHVPGA